MWDVPSHDRVHKLSVLSVFGIERDRLHISDHSGKLTSTTGLFLVCMVELGVLRDRLAVGHARFTTRNNDAIFTTHPFDVYLEMEFTHTRYNRLTDG